MRMSSLLIGSLIGMLLIGCHPTTLLSLPDPEAEPTAYTPMTPTAQIVKDNATVTVILPSSPTAIPTTSATSTAVIEEQISTVMSPTPYPTQTQTPTATPLPTPFGPCSERKPTDNLLAIVTLTYGLSRDFAPEDLVPLADVLPLHVTMGYPSQIRQVALQPLLQMIEDMQADGLYPRVLSAYRSYIAQSIAWEKWNELYPEHANIISAPPGNSEHQLGTVVDFGSPELAFIVGQEDIEFHTYFYKTSEGKWLAENAHNYGFTLSFPAEAFDISGFYFEPWHYRYVGVEMATLLHDLGISLTEYQLANQPDPCAPKEVSGN
jgi:D-alanyl-D-alanine carboxypeptidase